MNNYHNRYDKFNNPSKEEVKEFEDLQKELKGEVAEPTETNTAIMEDLHQVMQDLEVKEEVREEPVIEKVEKPVASASVYLVDGTPKLNVRELPNTDSKVLRVLNFGEPVSLTDTQQDKSEWFSIVSPVQGYVMRKYIKKA